MTGVLSLVFCNIMLINQEVPNCLELGCSLVRKLWTKVVVPAINTEDTYS
jgi:hypothetical protein